MRLHRFYIGDSVELKQKFWVNQEELVHQWLHVLRYRHGDQLILFNNQKEERLYEVDEVEPRALHLKMVTEMAAKTPHHHTYLFWSLLKKDNNDFVIQKATELGITNFVPLIAERSEKTGFNDERAMKITIEAAEQCGRVDIPTIHEPLTPEKALQQFGEKVLIHIAHYGGSEQLASHDEKPTGIMVGPEGGWSEAETNLFAQYQLPVVSMAQFTLRAETAAVVASYLATK